MAESKCEYIRIVLVPESSWAKLCMTDTAGLQFIVSTPAQTLDKHDRKAIRSHATRARATRPRKHAVQLWSWISPNRELGSLRNAAAEEAPIQESMVANAPSPRQFGSHFSGLQLPSGVEPHMIQDLVKCVPLSP